MATTIVALVAATLAGCDTPPKKTITLYEHDSQPAVSLDLSEHGNGPGDVFVFAGDLYDHKGGQKLGRAGGHATTTSGSPSTPGEMLMTVTFALQGGQIQAQGLFDTAALFAGQTLPMAITGGTGDYRDAQGDLTAQVPTDVPGQTDVNFVLNLS
jgi:hypothetical protein